MADESNALRQITRAREHVVPDLGAADVERLVAGAARRRERRRIRRSLGLGLAIGAVSASALWLLVRAPAFDAGAPAHGSAWGVDSARASGPPAASVPSTSPPQAARTWALSDQSRATALHPATEVAIEEDAPRRTLVRLEQGRARFEVARRPERTFQVRAGSVTVSVIGTVFEVEVVADRIGVAVEQGAVDVAWGVGRKRLVAGEQGWFPPLVLGGGDAPSASGTPPTAAAPAPLLERSEPASASQSGPTSARELLAESDAARTRGEPDRGAELLRRILREYPNDARAPLAAFTLGRLLLNELGKPRDAAATFHELQVRAPRGQFAEDALAREVEAWNRAAEPARARAVAETYLERYPAGRHVRRVKALAGLE
ncbi:MAG TPA: FecR domain-containing protein [Polyangiaceae bacterium]